jgi:nitroimidazol reductase NimA-like FMN-containing flavoprotein (pyridoxamine 5'-phosphate oxidase superfamily)
MTSQHRSSAARRPSHVEEMSSAECQELMAGKTVGRVGFSTSDGQQILPVNYAVADGEIFFRVAPDGALSAQHGKSIAFEVDEADEFLRSGWSVLVVGLAERIEDSELPQSLGDKPTSWAAGRRSVPVRITPSTVTGRRIHSA